MRQVPLNVEGWTFGRFADEIATNFAALPAIAASDHSRGGQSLRRWTYQSMKDDIHALQWALAEHGIKPGDRVGVMLSSVPEWVLYLFALARLGAAFMPINTRFRSRELHHVMSHSGACALVAAGSYMGNDYAALIAEAAGERNAQGRYAALPELHTLIGLGSSPGPDALDTDALLEQGRMLLASRGAPPREDNPESIAILFYTSGTTSFPKGVPLSHANLLPHSVRAGGLLGLQPGEKVLTLYPFFGISGGANKVLSTFGSGACLVFQDAYRPAEACDLLNAESCTVIHGVDVQIRELMAELKRRGAGPQPPRRATVAFTAGLDEALARAMADGLGVQRFIHPYGMTETNPMILRNELDDPFEVAVRAGGRVAPGVEVRVVDPESGQALPAGKEGEIVVRGSTVMRGYYRDPETTAAALRNGWFHTGDLGVATPDGYVFYVGRIKDMLKVGGFNVAPQEVEEALRAHPAVGDVAVSGIPDERLGEVPVAFVIPAAGMIVDGPTLIEWCRDRIANFKIPREVRVVDALPYHTAANGSKLQRHVLREWAQTGGSGMAR